MTQTNQTHTTDHRSTLKQVPAQQTFMDHIRELQSRLFYIAIVFLITAGAAYPFFTDIAKFIIAPLGDQELVYLTPAGAFSFVIQVCMYVGFVATLPVLVYHIFQFLSPVMPTVRRNQLITFTLGSLFLAIVGISFAYYVSLPAALYFLTSFSVADIDPMLTIDSYFSFAMAYLLAGAILFQLPLLLLIIDSVTPLTPKKLMGYQRHVILGAVIIAAVISPTPDVVNQLLLAGPLVVMYQAGIGMIGLQHRKRSKPTKTSKVYAKESFKNDAYLDDLFKELSAPHKPALSTRAVDANVSTVMTAKPVLPDEAKPTLIKPLKRGQAIDGFRPRSKIAVPNRTVSQHLRRTMPTRLPRRSIDGIVSVQPAA